MFLQGMYQFWASVDSYGVGGKGGVDVAMDDKNKPNDVNDLV